MFHTLAASNAGLIAGPPQSDLSSQAWERVYRRLDHGRAQNNLRTVLVLLSAGGGHFARTFTELQNLRPAADHDPNATITHSDAVNSIELAESAISAFARLNEEERRFIAAQSLFDRR